MSLLNKKIISILLFSILILFDQLSKYIIRLKGGFYICNRGISFGIEMPPIIFYFLWIVIIIFLILALYKKHNFYLISIILAGAISNFIDRLYLGCVVDFINLPFWPAFNFADIYITIGAIILIRRLYFKK